MLAAIAAPILPSPMKAIVNSSVGDFIAEHPLFVGHRPNDDTLDNATKNRILKVGLIKSGASLLPLIPTTSTLRPAALQRECGAPSMSALEWSLSPAFDGKAKSAI
jgi:hypothetical protein